MKTKFLFTAALLVLITVVNTFAYFNPKRVFESNWKGYGKQVVDETNGDYLWIAYDMYNIHFDAVSFTFTGHKKTTVEIDGQFYSSTVEFKAYYTSNTHEVFIDMGNLVTEDPLPFNMSWAHNDMKAILIPLVAKLNKYEFNGSTVDTNGNPVFGIWFYNEQDVNEEA